MNTRLDAIRERAESDFVTAVESCASGLAQDLMQARLDRQVLLAELDRLSPDYQNEPEGSHTDGQ